MYYGLVHIHKSAAAKEERTQLRTQATHIIIGVAHHLAIWIKILTVTNEARQPPTTTPTKFICGIKTPAVGMERRMAVEIFIIRCFLYRRMELSVFFVVVPWRTINGIHRQEGRVGLCK
mmetsp:Transcript_13441/g.24066  ORF Transcript_13441/g.24066 Transcript_13441/m.24066 type:complete len:119 (+) Transcript_13441:1145-1501(+)